MPELNVDVPKGTPYVDLRDRAMAACQTIAMLEEHGMEVPPPTEEDKIAASAISQAYAEDPERASKKVATKKVSSQMTPASMMMVRGILDEFSHVVVDNSMRIRSLVTNKLLLESENPDARVRLRALELLGKISDVGLFADKSEVTVTHQSSDELKAKLREKLSRLVNPDEEIEDAVIINNEVVDIEKEFGVEFDDDEG